MTDFSFYVHDTDTWYTTTEVSKNIEIVKWCWANITGKWTCDVDFETENKNAPEYGWTTTRFAFESSSDFMMFMMVWG